MARRILFQICLVLIIIGALNWGLVALSPSNDIILTIFSDSFVIRSILYMIIAIAGLIACYIWLSYPTDVCPY
jgi:uncharacterized membrane protein YuzA (DUF378 family)